MRSLEIQWLLRKELRELFTSRPFWLLLFLIGPLVGQAFCTAVESYAEASGLVVGGPAALAQGLSPLDGILVPTFAAYDLVVTLLFPFVVIRAVASERESGAWKLLLQSPASMTTLLTVKALVLLLGWMLVWVPGLAALGFWKLYGGALYAPEVMNLLLGHLLRVMVGTGVAVAAASIAGGAASAAIVTLGFTVGTWVLEFVATGRGGWAETLAGYTPTAILRLFEQGLLPLNAVIVSLVFSSLGFVLAGIWLSTSRHRILGTALAMLGFGISLWVGSLPRAAWDVSENRRNSFPVEDEAALRQMRDPLRVTAYLAPEDPRLTDLSRNILSKFRRALPKVEVEYRSHSRAGLFEPAGEHYGEVWYEMNQRKVMSRSTTEPIVLAAIYELAQVTPPVQRVESAYAGHPLAAYPSRAAAIFYYGFWPCAIGMACWYYFKNRN